MCAFCVKDIATFTVFEKDQLSSRFPSLAKVCSGYSQLSAQKINDACVTRRNKSFTLAISFFEMKVGRTSASLYQLRPTASRDSTSASVLPDEKDTTKLEI